MTNTESRDAAGVHASALRHAAELEPTNWAGAIDVLTQANRTERSDEVEYELAALRARGYTRLERAAATPPAAPTRSASIGPSGLPETTLDGLTAGIVRASILDHGSVLVRGAVDRATAQPFADAIDKSFAANDAYLAEKDVAKRPHSPWWTRFEPPGDREELKKHWVPGIRNWVRMTGGVLLADSPRFQFELFELYGRLGLYDLVTNYLGTRPVLSAGKCTLRRVELDESGGWHQDGAFLGSEAGIRAINLWLALDDCGIDAPGLDLVPRRFDHVVETGTEGSYFTWAAGDGLVEKVQGDAGVVRPAFSAGDLLIFDDLMLHRTAATPETTRPRHAVEMWCFAADAYPDRQVPLVW